MFGKLSSTVFFVFIFSSFVLFANSYNTVINPDNEGEKYLAFAEKMPAPIGGLEAIYKTIKYPEIAKKAGVEGKVYALAFINENGTVDQVQIIKGIGAGCDEEVIRAVSAAKFTPGMKDGKPVKVKLSIQIKFKLR